jgi:hypothetical protein
LSSTDKPIATVQAASAEDVDRAVKAAKAALVHPSWKLLPATERGQLMARLADLMEENRALFASIEAWDNGMHEIHESPRQFAHSSQENPTTSPLTKISLRQSQQFAITVAGLIRPLAKPSTQLLKSSPIQSASPLA